MGWVVVALIVAGLAGGGWYLFGRGGGGGGGGAVVQPGGVVAAVDGGVVVRALPVDAAVPAGASVLVIEWKPDGARVRVDGQLLDRTTPTEVEVASGVEHTIDIDKDGYAPVRIRESLAAGERKRSHGELVATRASLSVITQPAGAQVKLGGRLLGTTPLERHDLDPGGAELTLTLDGYQPLRVPVNLVAGATAKVNKPLKEAVREGTVRIQLPMGNWAYAYLGERQLGSVRAPITLPVGHYKLRLYNPQTGKERFIEVDVFEGREKAYRIDDW